MTQRSAEVGATFDPAAIPAAALSLCETLQSAGHRAWIVGGCVRDHLLGREVSDWDICTSARPDALVALFPRAIKTGIAHGTVTVVVDRAHYEVTTLRGDGEYADGRRPESVRFLDDIDEDLARRDFTVNAIAYDHVEHRLVDPFGGRADLDRRLLRAVGDPLKRFAEDGLRILRGARFVATLGFTLEAETERAFAPSLPVFRRVSAERVRDEWVKAMRAATPSGAFEVMRRTGIMGVTWPALAALDAPGWSRALAALDACVGPAALRVAALAHPLGDPAAVRTRMKQLRFSNDEQALAHHALRHASPPSSDISEVELRRWLQRVDLAHLDDTLALAEVLGDLDARGDEVRAFAHRVRAALRAGVPLSTRDLAVDGAVLMEALSIPASRRLGELLAALLEHVTEDPSRNERAALIAYARTLG